MGIAEVNQPFVKYILLDGGPLIDSGNVRRDLRKETMRHLERSLHESQLSHRPSGTASRFVWSGRSTYEEAVGHEGSREGNA